MRKSARVCEWKAAFGYASVVQVVAMYSRRLQKNSSPFATERMFMRESVKKCAFASASGRLWVRQCGAVCCSVLQCVAVCCSVLQCVAVCCSVLQCVAVCCNVVQLIAV